MIDTTKLDPLIDAYADALLDHQKVFDAYQAEGARENVPLADKPAHIRRLDELWAEVQDKGEAVDKAAIALRGQMQEVREEWTWISLPPPQHNISWGPVIFTVGIVMLIVGLALLAH